MYGIDISHYQDPQHVPYDEADFVIVKASEGNAPDSRVFQHVENTRKASKVLGLYHFYRRDVAHTVQIQTFLHIAEAVKLTVGDLFPALDVEFSNKNGLPNNGWNHPCEAICEAFEENYGGSLVYMNKRDFILLGSPKWVEDRHLWFAQYPKHGGTLHDPPKDPAIWQHRIGPFERDGEPGTYPEGILIDQDRMKVPVEELQIQGET